jgi:hypothetical protein
MSVRAAQMAQTLVEEFTPPETCTDAEIEHLLAVFVRAKFPNDNAADLELALKIAVEIGSADTDAELVGIPKPWP